jgi:hypothetical protein
MQKRVAEGRDAFVGDTIYAIQTLLGLHFEAESVAEDIRLRLAGSHTFDTLLAFDDLDRDRNGVITMNEFDAVLRKHGISATSDELTLLMDRYDRNRDGAVSYADFAVEVTPKSPEKRY